MADLSVLIRLHKHELDEKRRVLAALYGEMSLMEQARQQLETEYLREKEAADAGADIHFTFARYAESVQKKREKMLQDQELLQMRIDLAKESLMETFGELKKYEMTQEERERLEEEERRIREGARMDEIGIEAFRRRES